MVASTDSGSASVGMLSSGVVVVNRPTQADRSE